MNIHRIYAVFQKRFRPGRIRALRAMLPQIDDPNATILDLGGTADWWAEVKPAARKITIVNIDRQVEARIRAAGFEFACADACALPFADQQFDLVLSNSVIEHVGDAKRQQAFAAEMRRCGKALYMQTPNRWFVVEPHLIALGLHWLPKRWQKASIRWLSLWGWIAKPTAAQVSEFVDSTRLLSEGEVRQMFPDCRLAHEHVLGFCQIHHCRAAGGRSSTYATLIGRSLCQVLVAW